MKKEISIRSKGQEKMTKKTKGSNNLSSSCLKKKTIMEKKYKIFSFVFILFLLLFNLGEIIDPYYVR